MIKDFADSVCVRGSKRAMKTVKQLTFANIPAITLIQKVTTYWFVTNIKTLLRMPNF
jgi:hypothetical protein